MSRSFRIFAPLLAALVIAAAGCGKPDEKFVGSYTGKQHLSQKTLDAVAKMPNAAQVQAQMKKAEDASMGLTLNKDKTATLTATGAPQAANGTWALENNQIVLTVNGATGGPPMKLNPSADGKTLTLELTGPAADVGSLVFTKN